MSTVVQFADFKRKSSTETGIALWKLKVKKHAQLAAEMEDMDHFASWLRHFADEIDRSRVLETY